jgi:putative DNA primase/helicase
MGNIENKPDETGREVMAQADALPCVEPALQPGPVLINLADVVARPIEWLWRGVLARGKITILSSEPGCGKSTVTTDIAARLSKGKQWPVSGDNAPFGSSIFLAAEDDIYDTIRPRFDLADGDPSKIEIFKSVREERFDTQELEERGLNLSHDLHYVEEAINGTPGCVLVVVDPINSYIGTTDSHKDSSIRGAILAPLQALAGRCGVAILLVSHLRKSGGKAIHRTLGSIGFIGAARMAFGVVKDPDNEERRIMVCQKSNIWRDNLGFAYSLKDCGGFARVEWEPDPVTESADVIFQMEENGSGDTDDTDMLAELIRDILADGVSKPFSDIKEAIKDQAGAVGDAKLRKAIHKAGAKKNRDGFGGPVTWRIPPDE